MTSDNVLLIVLAILILVVAFVLPELRLRRAITAVIRIFRQNNAVEGKNAKTADELGLKLKTATRSLFSAGNPNADAMRVLRNAGVIQSAVGDKLYLSEENLAASKFRKYGEQKTKGN